MIDTPVVEGVEEDGAGPVPTTCDGPAAAPAGGDRRSRWRRTVLLTALTVVGTFIAAHLLLFASTSENAVCAKPVHLNSTMSYMFNCDSYDFLRLAHDPALIFQPKNVRQSRPGYVALGVVATKLFGPAMESSGLTRWYHTKDRAYLPLVLINFVALATAVGLGAALLLDLGLPRVAVAAVSAVIVINDVTKAFFWAPHQQIFVLLVPLVTVVVLRWIMGRVMTRAEITLLGLGLGASMLVYGSVVITVAAVSTVLLVTGLRGLRGARRVAVAGRNVGRIALFGAAVGTPQLVWMQLCKMVAGSYYSHETYAYHQFVWLPEAARKGWSVLVNTVVAFTYDTEAEIRAAAGAMVIVLVVAVVLARRLDVSLVPASPSQRRILVATGVTIAWTVVFCWALGFYQPRIAYHLVPLLLLLIGWVGARTAARSPALARGVPPVLSVLAAVWVGYELTKAGPYS